MSQKTCFVIIGFGIKTDYATGREIDLDKTFNYIIKPAFEKLDFLCFRASDIKHAGVIDVPMYDSILKADFVVADLSTANANVMYELGVRHAVRKNTTMVISEQKLVYPFDLNHILIDQYEHMGKAIDHGEVLRFQDFLQQKVKALLEKPSVDSPLYTFFPTLEVPRFTRQEIEDIKENIKENGSLSDYMEQAEEAKKAKKYVEAIDLLQKAKTLKQDNTLVVQRLALATYKSQLPDKRAALFNALQILEELNPSISTDVETLGLAGAIYKRLYEDLGDIQYLSKATWFYERGFYIGNDYYNGINLAYLFNVAANLETDTMMAYARFGNAKLVREKVREISLELISNNKGWDDRSDKEWIYLTLAEVYCAMGDEHQEKEMMEKARSYAQGSFAIDTYEEQRIRLLDHIAAFNKRFNI